MHTRPRATAQAAFAAAIRAAGGERIQKLEQRLPSPGLLTAIVDVGRKKLWGGGTGFLRLGTRS